MCHFTKEGHSEINGSNRSGKTWDMDILYQVASPLLLTAVCKHLGTEETSCWSFSERGMLSHSCLVLDSNCSKVLGLLCCIFCFKLWQILSVYERFELQAGKEETRSLLLWITKSASIMCSIALTIERIVHGSNQRKGH